MAMSLLEKRETIESVLTTTEQKVAMLEQTINAEKQSHKQLMERVDRMLDKRHRVSSKLVEKRNEVRLLKTYTEVCCSFICLRTSVWLLLNVTENLLHQGPCEQCGVLLYFEHKVPLM